MFMEGSSDWMISIAEGQVLIYPRVSLYVQYMAMIVSHERWRVLMMIVVEWFLLPVALVGHSPNEVPLFPFFCNIDGLVQHYSIPSALAMEILQSCIKPLIYLLK